MKTYRLTLAATTEGVIEVEAENGDEAQARAEELCHTAEWNTTIVQILDVTVVEEKAS